MAKGELLDRQDELAAIDARLAGAVDEDGGLLVIEGPAGIGKRSCSVQPSIGPDRRAFEPSAAGRRRSRGTSPSVSSLRWTVAYNDGRLYCTRSNDQRLFWRWFALESGSVGSQEYLPSAGTGAAPPAWRSPALGSTPAGTTTACTGPTSTGPASTAIASWSTTEACRARRGARCGHWPSPRRRCGHRNGRTGAGDDQLSSRAVGGRILPGHPADGGTGHRALRDGRELRGRLLSAGRDRPVGHPVLGPVGGDPPD